MYLKQQKMKQRTIRVYVIEFEGNKHITSKSMSIYGTTLDEVYAIINRTITAASRS